MIRLDRHTNLDFSLINVSAFILSEISKSTSISYDALLDKVTDTLGLEIKELYPYALNFLFLLGKITYQQEADTFIYNEA